MPATAARISFVKEPVRRAVSRTESAATRHGSLARRNTEPIESFFDDVADAQAIADARQVLLAPERRRFGVETRGMTECMALNAAGPVTPSGRYTDSLRQIDMPVMVAEIGFDFAAQKTRLVVWG